MAAPTLSTGMIGAAVWDNRRMAPRFTMLTLGFIGVAGIFGLGAALIRHRTSGNVANHAPIELVTGSYVSPSRPLPNFSLIDQHGRAFGPANLRGGWTMMFFGYTSCPDFCPTTLTTLAALEKRLRAGAAPVRPQVIFVSVDAKRDTPEQLALYLPNFDPEFIGLGAASQAGIETFATTLGVGVDVTPRAGMYTVDHTNAIFVLNPAGRLTAILTGPFTVEALRADLQRIVAGPT